MTRNRNETNASRLRRGRHLLLVLAALLWSAAAAAQHDHEAEAGGHEGHDHGAEAVRTTEDGHDDGSEGHDEHESVVELTAAEIIEFGIVTDTAGPMPLNKTLVLPGEIKPNADRLAHIVPRYEGLVREVRAGIGDRVVAGQTLAVIESDESLTSYDLKTLIGGTVIEKHLTLGGAVSRDEAVFVVADLEEVWVDMTVPQRDGTLVAVGQRVHLVAWHGGPETDGEISYVTPVLDEHTRTSTARLVLADPGGFWKPGMFVEATVQLGRIDLPLAVPVSALHFVSGESVVFVRDDHGFEPRHVVAGRTDGKVVEILSGLAAGEVYVREGGFTIKAELQKSSFGHAGHGH